MPEKKKAPVQIVVSDDVKWKLRDQATKEKKPLSVFVREALQFYLDHKGIEIDLTEGLETWGGAGRKAKADDA